MFWGFFTKSLLMPSLFCSLTALVSVAEQASSLVQFI